MSEIFAESPVEPEVHPVKIFSKVKLLQSLGLLTRKFNSKTRSFEEFWPLQAVFYLCLVSKPLFCFKPLISNFFPENHAAQLLIGNPFNYISGKPKSAFVVGVSIVQIPSRFIDDAVIIFLSTKLSLSRQQ